MLAGLGAFIIANAWNWEYLGADGPGAGFFPLWYGVAMVALAGALIVKAAAGRAAAAGKAVSWSGSVRALAAWGAFVASIALLKVLGFVLSFGLFTLFVVAGMYRRPLRVALTMAVAVTAGFFLVFQLALRVELPAGIFGF